jgi:3-hydroxybutyrate dehydrogenase
VHQETIVMNIHVKREAAHFAVKPLAGKVSVVTGSTSGIGLDIATALARPAVN